MENRFFDHERLDIYQAAIEFIILVMQSWKNCPAVELILWINDNEQLHQ